MVVHPAMLAVQGERREGGKGRSEGGMEGGREGGREGREREERE